MFRTCWLMKKIEAYLSHDRDRLGGNVNKKKEERMLHRKCFFQLCLLVGFIFTFLLGSSAAVELSFHGDMNHRFLLGTNHNEWISPANAIHKGPGFLDDDSVYDNFGEIKYRFWFEAASDNGDYKGVFATEIGGLRFGEDNKMDYSGDEIALEARWGYLDFQ